MFCFLANVVCIYIFIIKFPYNARFDWLKQRILSENKVQVNDIKLASKFLLRNFDKFDPNLNIPCANHTKSI